jgi:hypothetical protein
MAHLVLRPKPYPAAAVTAPPATDRVGLGRYLALHRFDCYKCHSASFLRVDDDRPERSAGFFGGGTMLVSANGTPIWSANLTPDVETGIGNWTEADFVRALRRGFRRDNTLLRPPMSMYPGMTDEEAAALFAYLRTVPPIRKTRPQPADLAPALTAANRGEAIYLKYQCTQCHGISGVGTHDLTTAADHLGSPAAIEAWIRNPASITRGVAMPAWQGVIAEDDYAPLVEYVRRLGERRTAAGAQAKRGAARPRRAAGRVGGAVCSDREHDSRFAGSARAKEIIPSELWENLWPVWRDGERDRAWAPQMSTTMAVRSPPMALSAV